MVDDNDSAWPVFPSAAGDASLDEFLAAHPPSRVPQSRVHWIYVESAHPHHVRRQQQSARQSDPRGLQRAWCDLCERKDPRPSAAHIHVFAQRFHVLSSKRMLFCRRQEVDDVWRHVAEAVVSGALGVSAKVSPAAPRHAAHTPHLRVRERLHGPLGRVPRARDAAPHGRHEAHRVQSRRVHALGHLPGNEWGIHASIYTE